MYILLLEYKQCGWSTLEPCDANRAQIAGGRAAKKEDHPWMARVYYDAVWVPADKQRVIEYIWQSKLHVECYVISMVNRP